eukprot:XP_017948619.1 PREDICTED: von Willebrand factor C and EGF domain-containing protein-like [Xenopus tropicalis]
MEMYLVKKGYAPQTVHTPSCILTADGCLFEGVSGVDGELFPNSPDNCTICICLAGNVTCIPPVCPPVTCTDPFLSDCCLRCPDGCEFQDHFYPHGSKFSRDDNGCTSCLCQNGAVECSFIPCPSLECPRENWVLEAGQCCFKCQEPMQRTVKLCDKAIFERFLSDFKAFSKRFSRALK